jgi:hypothetical protein
MRRSLVFVVTLIALGASSSARAQDAATCGSAFDQSQVRRDEGKLLEARRLLRICGGPTCSATQQKLCSGWLTDVEARMPSFVLAAKSSAGVDLVNVKVQMDGTQVATSLDGRAIDADPGQHSFVFQQPDGTQAQTTAVADERGKGKLVSVTFGAQAVPPVPAPVPAPAPAPAPAPPLQLDQPAEAPKAAPPHRVPADSSSQGGGSSLKIVGIVTAVAGVIGLGVGSVFGAEALSTKSAHCDSNGLCNPPGTASNAYNQATISTVGLVAGGVLLVGGIVMVIAAPSGDSDHPSASLAVAPMVGSSAGGLQLAGRW